MTCTPDKRRRWAIAPVLAALLGTAVLAPGAPGRADPVPGEVQVARARAALAQGDGIAAEVYLGEALRQGIPREAVAAAMGEALISQGQADRAREWLASGRFTPGEALHGWRMLGLLERMQGNLGAAGAAYDRALRIAPKDAGLWADIARLRYAGGEHLQAIEAADHALQFGPENPRAIELRAQLVRDRDGPVAALPWFERGLSRVPADLGLLHGYAATLGELGRGREMVAATRRMLEVAPGNGQAFLLQAVLAARAGDRDLARSLLQRSGSALEGIPAAMLLRGALELETGNTGLAIEVLDRLVRQQPANRRAQELLAAALYRAGRPHEVTARFSSLALQPGAPTYLLELVGRSYEELGDRRSAAKFLDRASSSASPPVGAIVEAGTPGVLAMRWREAPGSLATAVPYVRSLIAAGRMAEAAAVAERVRAEHPGSADAQELAGDAQLAFSSPGPALVRYQTAARVRLPERMVLRMGEAYVLSGQGGTALALSGRYLAQNPASRFAVRLAANGAAVAGDWRRAGGLLEFLAAGSEGRDSRLLADLALARLRLGDGAGALTAARQAYELQRASAVTTQAYAMALAQSGENPVLAQRLIDKARSIGGDNSFLREAEDNLLPNG